jgi:hypothetical protein
MTQRCYLAGPAVSASACLKGYASREPLAEKLDELLSAKTPVHDLAGFGFHPIHLENGRRQ